MSGVSKEEEEKSDEYSQDMTQKMGAGMLFTFYLYIYIYVCSPWKL